MDRSSHHRRNAFAQARRTDIVVERLLLRGHKGADTTKASSFGVSAVREHGNLQPCQQIQHMKAQAPLRQRQGWTKRVSFRRSREQRRPSQPRRGWNPSTSADSPAAQQDSELECQPHQRKSFLVEEAQRARPGRRANADRLRLSQWPHRVPNKVSSN